MSEKIPESTNEINASTPDSPVTPPTPKKTRKPRQSKPKTKTLNTKDWLKSTDDINKYSQYPIDKKNDIYVNYNEIFSEVKIEELLTELYNHIVYDKEKGLGFFNSHLMFNAYLDFLIIKYFTDMKDLMSDSVEDNIVVINKLREDEKFRIFFAEIFDAEQVIKVYERLNERIELIAKLENMNESQLEEIIQSVQTPFLKDKYTKQIEALKQSKTNPN